MRKISGFLRLIVSKARGESANSRWFISIFFPGIGQICSGRVGAGILIFACVQVYYILLRETLSGRVYRRLDWLPEWSVVFRTYGIPIVFCTIWLLNILDAMKGPKKIPSDREKNLLSLLAAALAILEVSLFSTARFIIW